MVPSLFHPGLTLTRNWLWYAETAETLPYAWHITALKAMDFPCVFTPWVDVSDSVLFMMIFDWWSAWVVAYFSEHSKILLCKSVTLCCFLFVGRFVSWKILLPTRHKTRWTSLSWAIPPPIHRLFLTSAVDVTGAFVFCSLRWSQMDTTGREGLTHVKHLVNMCVNL